MLNRDANIIWISFYLLQNLMFELLLWGIQNWNFVLEILVWTNFCEMKSLDLHNVSLTI